jgi:hypothetical protein
MASKKTANAQTVCIFHPSIKSASILHSPNVKLTDNFARLKTAAVKISNNLRFQTQELAINFICAGIIKKKMQSERRLLGAIMDFM